MLRVRINYWNNILKKCAKVLVSFLKNDASFLIKILGHWICVSKKTAGRGRQYSQNAQEAPHLYLTNISGSKKLTGI